jgi:hypothetical protein
MSEDTAGTTSFVRILGDSSSQNLINWQDGTALRFATSTQAYGTFNERARITSGGRLLVGTTTENTSGGVLQVSNGITFPATQSASSNANTLDDYEEGTWTPTTSTSGYTISTSSGNYTKIGRVVHLNFQVLFSAVNGSSNSNVILGGLPFTVGANNEGIVRDSSTTGAIYSLEARASETNVSMNSMDGIATGSQRTIRINETYVGTVIYTV